MKKVLGLVGSPRKGGNTEAIVAEALLAAKDQGAEIELLHLEDLDLQFCQGCMECREKGVCIIQDGLPNLVEKLGQADALIMGAPVYNHSVPGQLKALLDRLTSQVLVKANPNGIIEFESRLPKKIRHCLVVVVCSNFSSEITEMALATLKGFLAVHSNGGKLSELKAPGLGLPGQVKMELAQLTQIGERYGFPPEFPAKMQETNLEILKQARELGVKLVEE